MPLGSRATCIPAPLPFIAFRHDLPEREVIKAEMVVGSDL